MQKSPFVYNNFFTVVVAFLLLSCGQGNSSKANTETTARSSKTQPGYDTTLQVGIVKDTVTCRNDNGQAYALYLPTYYTCSRQWPCIILFDAHARGALPLRMYKDIAEQYGFILVGSNVSKNGLQPNAIDNIINTLWDDVHARINIDANRTYTSGFSGGAKVAAMAAFGHGSVAGVIGCAGGLPNPDQVSRVNFDYFGIAGDYDFNQPEMMQLDDQLANANKTHQLLTWSGIHAWPPASEYKTAILWMMVNSMKHGNMPKDSVVGTELKKVLDKRIAAASSRKDVVTAGWLLSGYASLLDGMTNIHGSKTQMGISFTNAEYRAAVDAMPQIIQSEQRMEQELSGPFTVLNEQVWGQKIAGLNQDIAHAKTPQVAHSMRRVLAFLGFVSYMSVSRATAAGDLAHAESYNRIFKMADPKNPDRCYFDAIIAARKADAKTTLIALIEAVKLGYSDVDQLMTEPSFAPIKEDPRFLLVAQQVRDNHDGKNFH